MTDKKWIINLTNIDSGIFRTMNGNADDILFTKDWDKKLLKVMKDKRYYIARILDIDI